ncbi:MAG TPA: signal peptide peptidase SppA [Deltaproteobacteria bacterium]|nr:signal peptide peptidase SppA [Deltaproteobacteria bacterium]
MPWSLAPLLLATAHAQGIDTHRPLVPSAGIATENGPGALWVNPANLAYDPDARFGLFLGRTADASLTSTAAVIGSDGLSLGVHNRLREEAGALRSDWSLDYGSSVALPERLAIGALVSWNFVEGNSNYLAYDAGLSWRPLPWLGLSGVAQNVGGAGASLGARARTGAGVALRPLGSFALFGLDLARTFPPDPDPAAIGASDQATGTVRIRPIEGLYLRGNARAGLVDGRLTLESVGAGIELYLEGVGLGGHLDQSPDKIPLQVGWLGTDEPGESLLRSGRRVPVLELDRTPPYQPRGGLLSDNATSWIDTLELLRRLEDDPGVRGLVLTLEGSSMPLARYRELRDRIAALEAEGKPVLVYLSRGAGNGEMYVASAASRIALHPAADVSLVGLSVQLTHLRGLLDLVGIEAQFVKRSRYKTAPETFTHPKPSPANLEMQEDLLDDLFTALVEGIASGRGIEPDEVRGWIDAGPMTSEEALDKGLVDVLLYPDQLEGELEKIQGGEVSLSKLLEMPQPRSPWEDPKQIALIYVEGPIVSGESSPGGLLSGRSTGATSIVRKLAQATRDPQVRAVVMRVDSPGGSSLASDSIWRAVEQLKSKGKPVVVSMGGVAASGGYYVAAGADAIWAEPETLTGSIGVFSGKFTTSELQEALGITTTTLSRGRYASLQSTVTPWDDLQRARMQALVDHTYAQFKERVASGRELQPDEVEARAGGRVWSGRRAKEMGLVDELGGFQEAIADARARAGLPASSKVGLVTYSDRGSILESLAPALATRALAPSLQRLYQPEPLLQRLQPLLNAADPLLTPMLHPDEGIWMMDPWSMEILPR